MTMKDVSFSFVVKEIFKVKHKKCRCSLRVAAFLISIPFCSFLRKLFCNLFLLSFSSFICFASLFFIYLQQK